MVELDEAPRRSDQALAQDLKGELVLIHVDTGLYFVLNDVGSRVWQLCDGRTTVAEIVSALCLEFEAESAVIEGDVIELVGSLVSERLLVSTG